MRNARVWLLVVAALVFVAIGFVAGQFAEAMISMPGTDDDPAVTQSYVTEYVEEQTAALAAKILELEAEIEALTSGTSGSTASTGSTADTGTTTTPDVETVQVQVSATTLNVRASASTSADKVGSVSYGEIFDVIASVDGWYKIELSDGTLGYISADYAKEV